MVWEQIFFITIYIPNSFIHTCDRVAMLQLEICKIFGWRFGLVTGDFLSTYLMHVFIVY